MAKEVSCVLAEAESITGLGGQRWRKDSETVIADIEHGLEYFVWIGPARVIVVIEERDGEKYLRTDPDSTPSNHLASLPACPVALA